MKLPFEPPLAPMLAKAVDDLPRGDDWLFEPKWDGFRTLVFRDGEELLLQSRDLKPMNRYFPELREPLLELLPDRCVLDGEVVITGPRGLDFDALLLRIHPAASHVAFDLLAIDDEDLRAVPQAARRVRLEATLAGVPPPLYLTPATRDRAV